MEQKRLEQEKPEQEIVKQAEGQTETEPEAKKKKMPVRRKLIIAAIVILILLMISDMRLKTVVYTVDTGKLDQPVRLALITDLHSCRYGREQQTLIRAVNEQKPDIILLGGDIFNDGSSYENAEITLQYLSAQYPDSCYYVTGNHEFWSEDIESIVTIVESYGITVLQGDYADVEAGGQSLRLFGVDDPDATIYCQGSTNILQQLNRIQEKIDPDCCNVLLSHRPELIDIYKRYDFDLVLSGHAHGGQWRIPGILNGLYAPNQGLLPKYAGGRYDFDRGTMIVSRGLARESTPVPRLFNRPELVIIDLQ